MKYKDFYDTQKPVKKVKKQSPPTIKKETVLDGIKKELNESTVHLMKVMTDKDNPPFKTPKQIQEEKLNEAPRKFAVKVVDMGHVLVDASSAAEAKRLVAKKLRRGLKDIEKVSRAFPTKKVSDVDSEKI